MGVPLGAWAAGTPRRLPHGDVVVRQGDPIECLFLVTSGAVRLASVTADGREVVVGLLGAGEVFGESALLDEPSPVDARAAGSADVVALPIAHLREVLRHSPATSTELLRLVAARLHRTSRALEDSLTGDVPTRLSRRLHDLAEAHGSRSSDGVRIRVPLTQDELARMIGASRETVNRALSGMSSRGLIRSRDRTIVIPDLAALDGPRGD
ncbi:MAG: Crp/Fnr family transcriptional regulator [Actinomycetota bacterium]